jgi:alkanesulfonate monooxygenase SsuD/methylene tetrahydromethanopterin reductase-like flavin-dependent oxidoreductase (luciferase family)
MHIGVGLSAAWDPARSPAEQFAERLALVRAARDLGFDSVWLGEHYLGYPEPWFQNLVALARFAADAEGMGLGAIVLLPLHNPIEIAEQVATLDALSGGHAMLTIAQGWRAEEFAAFGLDPRDRVGRLTEGLALLTQLWTQDEVTFEGRHFRVLGAKPRNRPVQQPHPPLWLGASSAAAVRRAARLGYPWFTSAHTPFTDLVGLAAAYRAALAARGQDIPARAVLWRHLHVAADRDAALREATPFLASYYKQFAQWGLFRDVVRSGPAEVTVDELLADGRVIIGSPDDALHALMRYREATGLPNAVFRVGWTGMPPAAVERSLQLLAERVVPALRVQVGAGVERWT